MTTFPLAPRGLCSSECDQIPDLHKTAPLLPAPAPPTHLSIRRMGDALWLQARTQGKRLLKRTRSRMTSEMQGSQPCCSITSWFLGFLKVTPLMWFLFGRLCLVPFLCNIQKKIQSLSQLHRVDLFKHKETSVLHLQGLGKQDFCWVLCRTSVLAKSKNFFLFTKIMINVKQDLFILHIIFQRVPPKATLAAWFNENSSSTAVKR